ncbi:Sugar phosphate permease [Halorubrum aquaticum]|uniref:Sugar phosphate permease n=1 Tax=Halorubrum aquaticum TaxID=387340 RepID=A0A1I3C2V1_9EURY|nr:MFS transporter [Halorubrum aquaticum]SFH68842.1 Sugar phosphate permease [Halorubrum aquaticum]
MNENGRSIVAFTMVSHAIVHTYELSIPILVVIWLSEFSVTTATIGTIVAVGYALFGIGALPSGLLADRYSTKSMVLIGLAGMGASFLLLSAAQGTMTIALALGLWGVFASIHHPASLSLISTGVSESGTGFAYHGMAGNLGIAFGPLVTASLLIVFDWRLVSALLVAPAVLAVAYALTAEFDEMAAVDVDDEDGDGDDRSDGPDSLSGFLADSRALFTLGFTLALAVVLMNGLFYRGTLTFLPDVLGGFLPDISGTIGLFAPDSPMAQEFDLASYLYAGLLTVGIAGQYVGGKLTDRIRVSAGLAAVFSALVVLSVAFIPVAEAGLWPLVAISAVFGFVLFSIQPLYQAAIAVYSPPDGRGLSYGYTYLANFGFGAAGAALAGFLLNATSVGRTFLLLALIPAVGVVIALVLFSVVDAE